MPSWHEACEPSSLPTALLITAQTRKYSGSVWSMGDNGHLRCLPSMMISLAALCLPLGASFRPQRGVAELLGREAPFLLPAAAGVMPARPARRQATGRARLAACSSSSNVHPAPPVNTAELPACTVCLFDAATQTHVYLIGSIHVRAYTSCARCGWCKNKRVRLHARA